MERMTVAEVTFEGRVRIKVPIELLPPRHEGDVVVAEICAGAPAVIDVEFSEVEAV